MGIVIWAAIWYLVLPLLASFLREFFLDKHPMRQTWVTLNRKTFKKSFMVDFDDNATYLFASEFSAFMFQHFGTSK